MYPNTLINFSLETFQEKCLGRFDQVSYNEALWIAGTFFQMSFLKVKPRAQIPTLEDRGTFCF